jgi:hypothetical protein
MSNDLSLEALARQIIVRYRGAGHVRFALPDALCEESFAAVIEETLRSHPGIYRVTFYRWQGKLSIFYDEHACELRDVARCLHGAIAAPAARKHREQTVEALAQRLHVSQPLQWLKGKTANVKTNTADLTTKAKLLSQFAALKIQGNPVLKSMLTEKAIINFLNDVVVFYLIKMHWEQVTQKWLKQPLRYGSAWLTTFYLVFLLVRFRKQAAKKP